MKLIRLSENEIVIETEFETLTIFEHKDGGTLIQSTGKIDKRGRYLKPHCRDVRQVLLDKEIAQNCRDQVLLDKEIA